MTTGQAAHAERLREAANEYRATMEAMRVVMSAEDESFMLARILACQAGAAALDELATLRAERDARFTQSQLVEAVQAALVSGGADVRSYVLDNDTLLARVQQLEQALRKARTFIEYARYELEPGPRVFGTQFPTQVCADEEMARIDAALGTTPTGGEK